jgi:hypothetical protein
VLTPVGGSFEIRPGRCLFLDGVAEVLIDLTDHDETVRLPSLGQGEFLVRRPAWNTELELLGSFYERPHRAHAGAFGNELFSIYVQPRHGTRAFASLSDSERARLRRAVVRTLGVERRWRALYGSSINPDERLLMLCYWRWQEQKDKFVLLGHEVEQLARGYHKASKDAASSLARSVSVTRAQASFAAEFEKLAPYASVDWAELLPKPVIDYGTEFGLASSVGLHDEMRRFVGHSAGPSASGPHGVISALTDLYSGSISTAVLGAGQNFVERAAARFSDGAFRLAPHPVTLAPFDAPTPWKNTVIAAATSERFLHTLVPSFRAGTWSLLGSDVSEAVRRQLDRWHELAEAMDDIERFEHHWKHQRRALYYLLWLVRQEAGIWELRALSTMTAEEAEEVILHTLEAVVLDGKFVQNLREDVVRAPYLNDLQRINIDHGLEHASIGDYDRACSPIYDGVEGAYVAVLIAESIIKLATNPNKQGKIKFESALAKLKASADLKTFIKRELFGTRGNPYRHGSASSGTRRQVLFHVVALAAWFEQFTAVPAVQCLAERVADELPDAITRTAPARLNP